MSYQITPVISVATNLYNYVSAMRNEESTGLKKIGIRAGAEVCYIGIILEGTVETVARAICAIVATPVFVLSEYLPEKCQFRIFSIAHEMALGGAIVSGFTVYTSLVALVKNLDNDRLKLLSN
jgi:hypothetical protein